jgi:hypothetical protein
MARNLRHPVKAGMETQDKQSFLASDSARHILAAALALALVVMVVAALLLSANEGASSLR